jgi:hypothetical protein
MELLVPYVPKTNKQVIGQPGLGEFSITGVTDEAGSRCELQIVELVDLEVAA